MDRTKRQRDLTLEDKPPGQKVSNMLLGKSRGQLLTAPERRKRWAVRDSKLGKTVCSGSLTPCFVNNIYVTAEIMCISAHEPYEVLIWSQDVCGSHI